MVFEIGGAKTVEKKGCILFWYRDVFFVVSRWPKSLFFASRYLFWYRDSAFCCSMSRSSSSWHQSARAFLGLDILWESRMGGFQEGGFQIVERAAFSSRGDLLLQGILT